MRVALLGEECGLGRGLGLSDFVNSLRCQGLCCDMSVSRSCHLAVSPVDARWPLFNFPAMGQRLWSMPVMYHTFLRPKVVRTAQARSLIKARLLPESGHV